MKYVSAKTVTKMLGVTAQTVRNWDRTGVLKPAYVKIMDIVIILKIAF